MKTTRPLHPLVVTSLAPLVMGAVSACRHMTGPGQPLTFAAVSAGAVHTCGLTTSGAVYCWGDNYHGELGGGSTSLPSASPVAVAGGLTFVAVSVGSSYTCGVTTGGAAYCWGVDAQGQLGDGSISDYVTKPVAVSGGLSFASVSAGLEHTCGVTTSGSAYCWGGNGYGEIGNGSLSPSTTPVAVATATVSVTAGGYHTCSVPTDGGVYCWGRNSDGELGGASTAPHVTPARAGLNGAAAVSAGGAYSCAVTTGGAAYCWGDNDYGQLGVGTTTGPQHCGADACSTLPVAVLGGLTFAGVSAGLAHACGVTTGGAAYCWGFNTPGQLGNGSTVASTTPVAVSGGLTFASVSAGSYHTCGVTTRGAAYCWGEGEFLGSGSSTNSSMPVPVSGP